MLIVPNAMASAVTPANGNTHQLSAILYGNSVSHLLRKYHARGVAIKKARATSRRNSLDNRPVIPVTDAPNTLRTPISLRRRPITIETMAKSPRQDKTMAMTAEAQKRVDCLSSLAYQR